MRTYTLAGLLAILMWGTTVAFSRHLIEALGTLTTGSAVYLLSGVLSCAYVALSRGRRSLVGQPKSYLLGCGALFVVYIAMLYLAIGGARDHTQVITVGLINYLWPAFSLAFSIPLLHKHARPGLLVGIALALAGTGLATSSGQEFSLRAVAGSGAVLPYICAFVAAVCWGLYSNLARRWGGDSTGGGVPLFLLASGIVLLALRLPVQETSILSVEAALLLLFLALGPAMLAYILWDASMRRGDIILVAALSYATPLLSSLISMVVLAVMPLTVWWLAALMVMAGAVICRWSIVDNA